MAITAADGELKITHKTSPITAPTRQMISSASILPLPAFLKPIITIKSVVSSEQPIKIAVGYCFSTIAAKKEIADKQLQINQDTTRGFVLPLITSIKYGNMPAKVATPLKTTNIAARLILF